MIQPFLHHLSNQQGALVQQLLRHEDTSFGLAYIQPLPQDGLFPAQLQPNV